MKRKRIQNEFRTRKPLPSEIAAAERMARKVDSLTIKDEQTGEVLGTVGGLFEMMTARTEKDAQ